MSNSSENYRFLKLLKITHSCHALVSESVQSLRVWSVLDRDPSLLIKQEQMNIVQERCVEILTYLIVSATNDHQSLVEGQECHCVANSTTWWVTLLLYFLPLCGHYFAFDAVGLEVLKLGEELSLRVLSTKEIETIKNGVRLKNRS